MSLTAGSQGRESSLARGRILTRRDRATLFSAAIAALSLCMSSMASAQAAPTGLVIDERASQSSPAQLAAASSVPDPLAPLAGPESQPGEPSEARGYLLRREILE